MTTQVLQQVDLESLRQLLITHGSIEAAALYGSAARGDLETHSDVDLLLVCRSSRKLSTFLDIQPILKDCIDKVSLTIYSEKELAFLRSASSLFLLHLSREAVVLFDRADFLTQLLGDFQPKKSYREDFQKSLRLLDPLRTLVEGAPNGLHRLSYIYSLFRVFGVYLLAESGIYEFSKSRMVRLLGDRLPEQRESLDLLSTLRGLNTNFFTGGLAVGAMRPTSLSVIRQTLALASLAQVDMEVVQVSYEDAIRSFDEALADRCRALDYRLRMWFLLLVYDGLNLYCSKIKSEPLTSFSESALQGFVESTSPEAIRCAVEEAVSYLHRYPLKYFLSDGSKINPQKAKAILHGVRDELMRG